jgi:hypothetical protein
MMDKSTQAEINRANDKTSHGPKAEQGKRISARSATRHGLLAKCLLLHNESATRFRAPLNSYETACDRLYSRALHRLHARRQSEKSKNAKRTQLTPADSSKPAQARTQGKPISTAFRTQNRSQRSRFLPPC